tara:strand:- start:317 stop:481 length:165 start_codon:yes stop_codon:yes gene_type:complete
MNRVTGINPDTDIKETFLIDDFDEGEEKVTELKSKGYTQVQHFHKTILSDIWGL